MSNKYTEDRNGYVTFKDVVITEAGVFQYLGSEIDPTGQKGLIPDKLYNVYRPPEEVSRPETIDSFKMQPWIPVHKMLGAGAVSAEKVGVQGVTGDNPVFKDGKLVLDKLKLFGDSLKSKIKKGLEQLSCGFYCQWLIESGVTPNGVSYDVKQVDIFGNHLASVKRGRVGSSASVALDSAPLVFNEAKKVNKMEEKEVKELLNPILSQMTELTSAMDSISQKVEDMEKKAEDEDEEEEGKKKDSGMDAAAVAEIVKQAIKPLLERTAKVESAMDEAADRETKANLVAKIEKVYGAFDHAPMSLDEVVSHGVEQSGIACDSAVHEDVLNATLDFAISNKAVKYGSEVKQKPKTFSGNGQDSKASFQISDGLARKLNRN